MLHTCSDWIASGIESTSLCLRMLFKFKSSTFFTSRWLQASKGFLTRSILYHFSPVFDNHFKIFHFSLFETFLEFVSGVLTKSELSIKQMFRNHIFHSPEMPFPGQLIANEPFVCAGCFGSWPNIHTYIYAYIQIYEK